MAKFKAARDREREATGKCEGRKSYAEAKPELVGMARELSGLRPRLSLRQISAQLAEAGYRTPLGLAMLPLSLRCSGDKGSGSLSIFAPQISRFDFGSGLFWRAPHLHIGSITARPPASIGD